MQAYWARPLYCLLSRHAALPLPKAGEEEAVVVVVVEVEEAKGKDKACGEEGQFPGAKIGEKEMVAEE